MGDSKVAAATHGVAQGVDKASRDSEVPRGTQSTLQSAGFWSSAASCYADDSCRFISSNVPKKIAPPRLIHMTRCRTPENRAGKPSFA